MSKREPKPYVFLDLEKSGKTWKVKLHVSEGFLRIENMYVDDYPKVPQLLGNAGLFPEVNNVTLLKGSNTFIVRLNATYAWDAESAEETIAEISERLDTALQTGELRYVTETLQQKADEWEDELHDVLEKYPRLPEREQDIVDPLFEDVYEEDQLSSVFDTFLGELDVDQLADVSNDDDDDDDDYYNGGGNIPVPV